MKRLTTEELKRILSKLTPDELCILSANSIKALDVIRDLVDEQEAFKPREQPRIAPQETKNSQTG